METEIANPKSELKKSSFRTAGNYFLLKITCLLDHHHGIGPFCDECGLPVKRNLKKLIIERKFYNIYAKLHYSYNDGIDWTLPFDEYLKTNSVKKHYPYSSYTFDKLENLFLNFKMIEQNTCITPGNPIKKHNNSIIDIVELYICLKGINKKHGEWLYWEVYSLLVKFHDYYRTKIFKDNLKKLSSSKLRKLASEADNEFKKHSKLDSNSFE